MKAAIRRIRTRTPVIHGLMALAGAVGLKWYYSGADGSDLAWILGPTAALVARLTGIDFVSAGGEGYLAPAAGVVIAPACAGVNFLIIAFLTGAFTGIRPRQPAFGVLISAALMAYGLTVAVNAIRIILSMGLYDAPIYTGPITPDRVHRIGGVLVYFPALLAFHAVLSRFRSRAVGDEAGPLRIPAAPMAWYLGIALGVPMIHAGLQGRPIPAGEHAATVVAVAVGISIIPVAGRRACHRLREAIESRRM